ncbi:MAG TPA: PilZ domain-containing protein [Syntrophales bacterium]|nr:PilZ domain-containing protein [Syntrophales bacterium]
MSIKLILVCREGASRQIYHQETKSDDVEVDIVSSYNELFKNMINIPYHGIMIDMLTIMKASKEEKDIAHEVLQAFPTVLLNWDRESGSIRTIPLGKASSSDTLNNFINVDCRHFEARSIHLYMRKNIHFNVMLSREETMSKEFLERTVTLNVSKSGCFLFSVQDWSNIRNVYFVIKELQDKTPIVGEIRWSVEWGKTMAFPGIGIRFKHIKQEQLDDLMSYCQM